MDETITVNGLRLAVHFARPPAPNAANAVVLCHGFPHGPRGATQSAATFPELADRVAREIGWLTVTFNFRGTGGSEGDFSIAGWLADLGGVIDQLAEREHVDNVWLVGIAEGGTLALCAAADDARVAGVAVLAAPPNLRDWGRDPSRLLEYARRLGMINTPGFPESTSAWSREALAIDAVDAARQLAPRRVLVLHGTDDHVVEPDHARLVAQAAGTAAEVVMLSAAGHELRHDPRAIATLLGWLDRQR